MKILEVISYFYPAWSYGGPGKLVYEISSAISGKHELTVYSTDAYSKTRRRQKKDNKFGRDFKAVFFANISNFLAFRFKLFFPPKLIPVSYRNIRNFEVVHFHEFFTGPVLIVSFFCRLYGIPYLISAHGTLHSFHLNNRKILKKIFFILIGSKVIKGAGGFIAATPDEITDYENLGIPGENISLVANGINTGYFSNLPEKGIFRKKYNIRPDEKILLYLGRINKLKGLDYLLMAFAEIKNNHNIRLVIAGSDDGNLSGLKVLAKKFGLEKNIIFPGVIEGTDKLNTYRDTDIFVYPSPSEGFSLAILEAAACSLPLLITEGCNFPEVEKYNAGTIVKYSVPAIRLAIEKMLRNNQMLHAMGLNAEKLIEMNYSMTVMSEKLIKVYEKYKKNIL